MKEDSFWEKIRDWTFLILFIYMVLSITALFYINYALNEPLTLNTINNWISLILGLVATIFSILSMWVSFYSLEKSNKEKEENIQNINALKDSIINTVERTNETYLKEFYEIKSKIDVTISKLSDLKDTVNSKIPLYVEQVGENESKGGYDVKEEKNESKGEYDVEVDADDSKNNCVVKGEQ